MDLIGVILPVFLIFSVGFIGQRALKLDIKSISTLSLYLMTPFLTFEMFYSNKLEMKYFYILVAALLIASVLIGITSIIGIIIKTDREQLAAIILGNIFPNSGNYGVPVALFVYGTIGFDYAIVITVLHNIIINTVGIFIASYGGQKSMTVKEAILRVVKMPVLHGVVLGIVFQLLHLELPSNIVEGVSLVGDASIPTVMLILGMQLAEMKPQKIEWKYVNQITVMRMVASPIIAWGIIGLMPVDDLIKDVFILLYAMPVAASTTILAVQFGINPDLLSFTTLITTLVSLITIPVTLFLL